MLNSKILLCTLLELCMGCSQARFPVLFFSHMGTKFQTLISYMRKKFHYTLAMITAVTCICFSLPPPDFPLSPQFPTTPAKSTMAVAATCACCHQEEASSVLALPTSIWVVMAELASPTAQPVRYPGIASPVHDPWE